MNKTYFNLDHKIVFYVPSTTKGQEKITGLEFNKRTELIAGLLSDKFGGASIQNTQGFYKSNTGKIIVEDIKQVICFCSQEDLKKYSEYVLNLALEKCHEWSQESIGLEIDTKLYFIS